MANAMVALATITLGTSATSITFSSIPTTGYRDLRLVVTRLTTANANLTFRVNGDSSAIYNYVAMLGNGTAASSVNGTNGNAMLVEWNLYSTTSETVDTYVDFLDYAQTDKHKSLLVRSGRAAQGTEAYAGRYASTSAITSINLLMTGGPSFAAGTMASLYGIVS